MGDIFTVPYAGTPAAATVPWEATCAAGRKLRLLGFNLESETAETDQQLSVLVSLLTGSWTAGSGGTTPTPAPTVTGKTAAFTCRIGGTAPAAGSGTKTTVFRTAQPARAVAYADPILEVGPAQGISVEVGETASAAMVGTAVFEEV